MNDPLEDPALLQAALRALSDELNGARAMAAAAAELLAQGPEGEPEDARRRRLAARGAALAVARGVAAGNCVLGDAARLELLERLGGGEVRIPDGLLGGLLLEAREPDQGVLPLARPVSAQSLD